MGFPEPKPDRWVAGNLPPAACQTMPTRRRFSACATASRDPPPDPSGRRPQGIWLNVGPCQNGCRWSNHLKGAPSMGKSITNLCSVTTVGSDDWASRSFKFTALMLRAGCGRQSAPEIYRQAAHAGFDLILSGHTHGGQICLPGGIPILLEADVPRALGAGSWRHRRMVGYTSVGTGSSVVPVRFNNRPEITLHRLVGAARNGCASRVHRRCVERAVRLG